MYMPDGKDSFPPSRTMEARKSAPTGDDVGIRVMGELLPAEEVGPLSYPCLRAFRIYRN